MSDAKLKQILLPWWNQLVEVVNGVIEQELSDSSSTPPAPEGTRDPLPEDDIAKARKWIKSGTQIRRVFEHLVLNPEAEAEDIWRIISPNIEWDGSEGQLRKIDAPLGRLRLKLLDSGTVLGVTRNDCRILLFK